MYSVLNTLSEYIYTFTYKKTLLHTLLLLVFKIVESFKSILKLSSFAKDERNIMKGNWETQRKTSKSSFFSEMLGKTKMTSFDRLVRRQ